MLAEYFQSVYSDKPAILDAETAVAQAAARSAHSQLVVVDTFTEKQVLVTLSAMKPKHSPGPDGIPPFVFKDMRFIIAKPLSYIFSLCLKTAEYPKIWKLTRVVPIPKKTRSREISEHRPVAMSSAPAKIFEILLQTSIRAQITNLSDSQHGFRSGRSTTTNLMVFMATVTPIVDAGGQVDVAYFDFKKAFDSVDNDLLLQKLAALGCTNNLITFFASFLRDRRQYVECNGRTSEEYPTYSGVNQGSSMGPLEFLIFLSDVALKIKHATLLAFADDIKLIVRIVTESDCELLQEDITNVLEWSKENKLHLNNEKCQVMSFTRAKTPIQAMYQLGSDMLKRVTRVRDLGVIMDPELTFHDHTELLCKSAFKALGFVLREAQQFTNLLAIKNLYNAFVRSKLECNALIWNPYEKKYTAMVEKIQRKFLRFLYYKQYGYRLGYPTIYPSLFVCGMVGYQTLETRREVALAMYVARVVRGESDNSALLAMVALEVPRTARARKARRPHALLVPGSGPARSQLMCRAPLPRALNILNEATGGEDKSDIFHSGLHSIKQTIRSYVEKRQC